MKSSMTLALAANTLLVAAQEPQNQPRDFDIFGVHVGGPGFGPGFGPGPWGWGDGKGRCAGECVSSFWETATPTPSAWCDSGNTLQSCISSACSAEGGDYSSYSSRSSSLCSEYQSCTSTGTYTYTYQTPDGDWPFRFGGDKTWPTGEVTYTGCPWNGDGWGFPFWGGLGYGEDFWDHLGEGWKHATKTTTITAEVTGADGSKSTTAKVVTVEEAVSGSTSTFRTLAAETTGSNNQQTPNAAPTGDLTGVKVVGVALGAVVAVAGLM